MANAINGNSVFIDSTGALNIPQGNNIKVVYIAVTATAANALLTLQDDASTPVNKIELGVPTNGETRVISFEKVPIVFPNGIRISQANDVFATIVFTR